MLTQSSQRGRKNVSKRTNFQPQECTCSTYPYPHQVIRKRTWERHLKRKANDQLFGVEAPVVRESANIPTDPLPAHDEDDIHMRDADPMRTWATAAHHESALATGAGYDDVVAADGLDRQTRVTEGNHGNFRINEGASDGDLSDTALDEILGGMAQLGFVYQNPNEDDEIFDEDANEYIWASEHEEAELAEDSEEEAELDEEEDNGFLVIDDVLPAETLSQSTRRAGDPAANTPGYYDGFNYATAKGTKSSPAPLSFWQRIQIPQIHTFPGCLIVRPISDRDLLSFAASDIRVSHTISRSPHDLYMSLFKAVSPITPYDARTTFSHMATRTGIRQVRYDCCRNSCFCYAKDDTLTKCPNPNCGPDRWKPGPGPGRILYKTYDHIPLIPRLRLQYADPQRAQTFTEYRAQAESVPFGTITSDFWNSRLFRSLKIKKGLFSQPTDIAFFMSTDGVRVFKTRSNFVVWPIIFINLNLPPDQRYLKENLLLIGIIPGPKQPWDLDSYLYPIVKEMIQLQAEPPAGIIAWNGFTRSEFHLRAHITIIGADQPGREKLMRMKGCGSYKYCSYCDITGCSNGIRGRQGGTIYCPFHPPPESTGQR